MPKEIPDIAAALAANDAEKKPKPASRALKIAPEPKEKTTTRAGQTNVSGWFDMPVKHTLEELRLKRARELGRRVTLQELMGEAFNDLFKKHGLPEVAPGAPE